VPGCAYRRDDDVTGLGVGQEIQNLYECVSPACAFFKDLRDSHVPRRDGGLVRSDYTAAKLASLNYLASGVTDV
jgi:hypothetical protein